MPLQDLITMHFDNNECVLVLDLLSQIRDILQPKLKSLTAEERQRFGSIGEENKKLVNKVRDLIEQDATGLPELFDTAEFHADYKDRHFLESVCSLMDTLLFEVESTKILHDNDNYKDALNYYNYQLFRQSIGGAKAEGRVEQMRPFFQRKSRNTNNPSSPSDDNTPA